MADLDAFGFLDWIDRYEREWRTAGTVGLADLFADDATYQQSPYEQTHVGLAAIAVMWDEARDSPDEAFTMDRTVVAVAGDTSVARMTVRYGDPLGVAERHPRRPGGGCGLRAA